MANFSEIDRKEGEYIRDANDTLASMRDKRTKWWEYSVSPRQFTLVVGDATGRDNIVLWLSGCKNISGPVFWENQNLEIIWRCDR